MVGIISYGAYVPLFRLSREAMAKGARGEKAIGGFDEDAVTMAAAAATDCLNGIDRGAVDGLYLATTTSPYKEKLGATIVAMAADLREDIFTADFANSLRAGTSALRAAMDAIKAGSAKKVLVAAADCRLGTPGSAFEQNFGDGAGALLIGDSDVAASIEASYSVYSEILDVWRADGDTFVRSWEERFTSTHGYLEVVGKAVSGLLKKSGLKPGDFSKVVLYTPDARRGAELAGSLGFDVKTQLQDPLFATMGNTGTAYPLMLLVAALEEAKAGDRILFASYGNGSDAFVLQVTKQIDKIRDRRGVKKHLASKKVITDYKKYLVWHGILPREEAKETVRFFSAPAAWRERDANLRLQGVKCKVCGTVQFPPQRVCTKCYTKDQFEPYRLSDKKAKIVSFAMDYVTPAPDMPTVTTTIDFDGGGRMECYMTDREPEQVKVGLPLEMSFRRIIDRDGARIYFWKSMPVRV
jgi:3-hydroxy-3-methylglutaryl CoA synthase